MLKNLQSFFCGNSQSYKLPRSHKVYFFSINFRHFVSLVFIDIPSNSIGIVRLVILLANKVDGEVLVYLTNL